jgi:hypothetical protein
MDFIVGLPRTRAGYDSIWVVVDRLTKSAHFIPVKTSYNSAVLAELYMSWIVCLHGVPKNIVSDRGTQFTCHFWQQLHEALGTHLSAFDPGGSLDRRVNCRCVSQPRWVDTRRNTEGGKPRLRVVLRLGRMRL